MSKPKLRARLTSLSFSEKIKILEKLRDRGKAIVVAGLRAKPPQSPRNSKKIYCEHGALTREMKELRRSGNVELVHFPYDPDSHTQKMAVATPSKARIGDLNLSMEELPGLLTDYVPSSRFSEILNVVGGANRRDALHVDSALKEGCVAFVTCDGDVLKHASELEILLGIKFYHPTQYRDLQQYISEAP